MSLNDLPILTRELVTFSSISKHEHPLSIAGHKSWTLLSDVDPVFSFKWIDCLCRQSVIHGPRIVLSAQVSFDIFVLFQAREYGLPRTRTGCEIGVAYLAAQVRSHAPCCANQKTSSASAPKPSSVVLRVIV